LDKYEKEKLFGLFSFQKDGTIFILDVVNVIENEIVIMLNDKSCHSVTMMDNNFALNLFQLIKEIKNRNCEFLEIRSSDLKNEAVIITNRIK
jgi:hypothetical protein